MFRSCKIDFHVYSTRKVALSEQKKMDLGSRLEKQFEKYQRDANAEKRWRQFHPPA